MCAKRWVVGGTCRRPAPPRPFPAAQGGVMHGTGGIPYTLKSAALHGTEGHIWI